MLPRKTLDWLFVIVIAAFAFWLNLICGQRGFLAFDQSIVFDGGYRICAGQQPYRDFLIPTGPVVFWLQSIFFRLGGVNYFAYILHASLLNTLAALLSLWLLRLTMPGQKLLSYGACFLTAVWFYPPFGTPWFEQTAFFFSLVALIMVVGPLFKNFRHGQLLIFGAGLCQALSILSKQNAGLLFLFVPVILLLFARRYFYLLVFLGGVFSGTMVFLAWLFLFSEPQNFYTSFFLVPSKLGLLRLFKGSQAYRLWSIFFGSPSIIVQSIVSIVALIGASHHLKTRRSTSTRYLALIILSLVFFQYIVAYTSDNQAENSFPYTGLIVAIAVGLFIFNHQFQPKVKAFFTGLFLLLFALLLCSGISLSLKREVQDIFARSRFNGSLNIPGLGSLKWARPTKFGTIEIKSEEVEKLYLYLRQERVNFFVFPDFTILYGLLGVPSPAPLVWFDQAVTYDNIYSPRLDDWIIESLNKHKVEIVVLEKVSLIGTLNRLRGFPKLISFIAEDFVKQGEIGIFEVYRRMEK